MSGLSRDSKITLLDGAAGTIEVVLHQPTDALPAQGGAVAVVCHPHPLHQGTMDNKVVTTLARSYRDLGIPVARFNFRGVGASEGEHDNAVGEVDDLITVVDWLRQRYAASSVLLSGFSFGSAVAAAGSFRVPDVGHLVLVAPPVDRYDYDRDGRFDCPACVIMGGRDELVDADAVYRWVDQLRSPVALVRMPDATHFFHGHMVAMRTELTAKLSDLQTTA